MFGAGAGAGAGVGGDANDADDIDMCWGFTGTVVLTALAGPTLQNVSWQLWITTRTCL